jgi:hypothetical protein
MRGSTASAKPSRAGLICFPISAKRRQNFGTTYTAAHLRRCECVHACVRPSQARVSVRVHRHARLRKVRVREHAEQVVVHQDLTGAADARADPDGRHLQAPTAVDPAEYPSST